MIMPDARKRALENEYILARENLDRLLDYDCGPLAGWRREQFKECLRAQTAYVKELDDALAEAKD